MVKINKAGRTCFIKEKILNISDFKMLILQGSTCLQTCLKKGKKMAPQTPSTGGR